MGDEHFYQTDFYSASQMYASFGKTLVSVLNLI